MRVERELTAEQGWTFTFHVDPFEAMVLRKHSALPSTDNPMECARVMLALGKAQDHTVKLKPQKPEKHPALMRKKHYGNKHRK